MTLPEIQVLSDVNLDFALMRAQGWKDIRDSLYRTTWHRGNEITNYTPKYSRDLNACAELRAEVKKRGKGDVYVQELACILLAANFSQALGANMTVRQVSWLLLNATARQHSEAALMALQGGE